MLGLIDKVLSLFDNRKLACEVGYQMDNPGMMSVLQQFKGHVTDVYFTLPGDPTYYGAWGMKGGMEWKALYMRFVKDLDNFTRMGLSAIVCAYKLNVGIQCIFDDDICNRIVEKLNEADALIVGSPVYYGQPNGAVMAVLQRAFFSGAQVQNKPAAAVAICRRGGATAAYQTMNMIFEMMNMPVVTSQYWNIAYGLAPGEVIQDTEGMQTMRVLADNMAWLLKKIHANGNPDYPEREEWQGMNFIR